MSLSAGIRDKSSAYDYGRMSAAGTSSNDMISPSQAYVRPRNPHAWKRAIVKEKRNKG